MKLPVWQTYIDVFDYCWRERRAALKFSAVPFVVVLALLVLMQAFGINPGANLKDQSRTGQLMIALNLIVEAIVYLPMAVSWYRMVVLGDVQAKQRPAFTLGRLEGRLLWWQIIIVIVAVLALAAVGVLSGAVYIAVGLSGNNGLAVIAAVAVGAPLAVMILATVIRLAMVLVLVAAEKPVSLKIAWGLTRGYATRLFILVVLISLTGAALIQIFKLVALLAGMIAAIAFNSTVNAIVPYLALVGQDLSGLIVFLATSTLFGMIYLRVEKPPETDVLAPGP